MGRRKIVNVRTFFTFHFFTRRVSSLIRIITMVVSENKRREINYR